MEEYIVPTLPHPFKDSRVLVLGGSSGIGLATAALAADHGASVSIAGRSAEKLARARQDFPAIEHSHVLDMTHHGDVAAFFASSDEWDHVVVAGSETKSAPLRKLPMPDAYAAMQNKFWGAYHVAHACRIRTGGSLTLVSGVFSIRPSAEAVLQGAINAALEGLMRGLALELAPIRVNAISPSVTDTPLWDQKFTPEMRARKFDGYAKRVPLGRIAQARDVAQAIVGVAGNPGITGATLLVDCGDALT
jgi:NAD(P)-dependent dehydrogenase (short-subunit alcohol dehydrogenase family)